MVDYSCLLFNAEINIDELLSRWKEVIMFYCLRLLLGPVIESLILLDRCLYLRENGKRWFSWRCISECQVLG